MTHGATATSPAVSMDTLRDGVRHLVNVPPAGGGVPQWTLKEELRLGNDDGSGPAGFAQVKALEVTSDGRIAVLETMAEEIRPGAGRSEDGRPVYARSGEIP